MNELENRVYQFRTMSLPGQPLGMHMGTSYLVNDLWKRVQELERQNELLRPVAKWANKYWAHQDFISEHNLGPSGKFMDWEQIGNDDWENEKQTRKALKDAIDGGAMGEG